MTCLRQSFASRQRNLVTIEVRGSRWHCSVSFVQIISIEVCSLNLIELRCIGLILSYDTNCRSPSYELIFILRIRGLSRNSGISRHYTVIIRFSKGQFPDYPGYPICVRFPHSIESYLLCQSVRLRYRCSVRDQRPTAEGVTRLRQSIPRRQVDNRPIISRAP